MINIGADPDNTGGCQGLLIAMEPVNLTAGFSGSTYPLPGSVSTNICVLDDEASIVAFPTEIDVDEGETATLSVRLLSSPGERGGSVGILEALLPAGGSVTPKVLTYDDTHWGVGQTVTLDAGSDDYTVSEAGFLVFGVTRTSHPWYGQRLDVPVMVNDDDVEESDVPVAITDEGMEAIDVMPMAQPVANVEVGISSRSGTDIPTSQTFGNQSMPQPMSAVTDTDFDDESGTLTLVEKGGDYRGKTAAPALDVSPLELTVYEGSCSERGPRESRRGTGIISIKLTEEPSYKPPRFSRPYMFIEHRFRNHSGVLRSSVLNRNRSTRRVGAHNLKGWYVGSSLRDDPGWETPTQWYVCARDNKAGETSEIWFLPYLGNYRNASSVGVTVNVVAVPPLEIELSVSELEVSEEGSAEYTVKLARQPRTPVTVNIASDNLDVTTTPQTLTFEFEDFNDAQTVTVNAAADADFDDDMAMVTHTASDDEEYEGVSATLEVTVKDNTPGLVFNPDPLSLDEGSSADYTVQLAGEPTAAVTVDITGMAGTDLTLNETSLTFTTANWSEPQMVTVFAGDDDDAENDTATLKHTGDYAGQPAALLVLVEDDETKELVRVPPALPIPEGVSEYFDVALSAQPTSDVMVTISGHTDTDLELDQETLTFTPANWRDPQTVMVTAWEDEDPEDDYETLTLSASGGGFDNVTHNIEVTVEDDESAELLVLPVALSVPEGESASFTVALSGMPTGTVAVTVPAFLNADLASDLGRMLFTTTNWSEAQLVKVTAAHDNDFINETETLTLSASGGGYEGVTHKLEVTVIDNVAPGLVAPMALSVVEGASESFSVALSDEPMGTVTVTVPTFLNADLSRDPGTLTFTTTNWNDAQMVKVTAAYDVDLINDTETLTLSASGGGYEGVTHKLEVTVIDNVAPGLVAPLALEVPEGSSESFSVALSDEPMGTVTVTVPAFLNPDLSRDPGILTFTTANWSEAQMVMVTAAQDDDFINDEETLMLTADGGGYAGVAQDILVTVEDDESAELVVMPDALALTEGTSGSFTVALSVAPTTDVLVSIVGHAGTDLTLDRELLTFTTADWSEAQMVVVTAAEDDDFINDEETLTLSASGGGFAEVAQDILVTVEDDESAELVVMPDALALTEGTSGSFTVALSAAPMTDVLVSIVGHAGTDLTLGRELLTFTAINWNTAQTVTVAAAEDDDFTDDQVTLTLSASGGGFAGVAQDILVMVEDSDEAALGVQPLTLRVDEGETADFTAALLAAPLADVTVTITGHAGSDLNLDKSSLTFTTTNWSDAQMVAVTAAEDDDFENDPPVTLTLSASGGGYTGVSARMVVTVDDNDEAALVVQPLALSVDEGGTAAFTAALSAAPPTDVTVTITGHAGTDLTLDHQSLTFTTTNWKAAQMVRVTAERDDDITDDRVTLTLAASGGGFDGVTLDLPVTVIDAGALTVSIEDAEAVEGTQMLRMRVVLNRPADRVVGVNYATSDRTAEQSSDYMSARGMMILDRGATHGVLSVELKDDDLAEGNEVFEVTLTNASEGLTIGRSVGEGVILDDDGVPLLRIEDVAVSEEEEVVRFTLRLSEPSARTVTVRYRTEDGSAQAGMDYVAAAGMVQFKPGRTEAVLEVELMQDGMDWREETFTVHLEAPEHSRLEKAVATATVRDETSVAAGVMAAYASRFVRTSAIHVVEALESRMRSGVGGSDCSAGLRREESLLWHPQSSWNPSLGQLLSGCRVSAHAETPRGVFSAWGRASYTQFHGRTDDALTLRGQVSSGLAGADYRWHQGWMAGVLLAHSYGEGTFEVHQEAGDIRAGLTGVYPYLAYHRPAQTYWLTGGFGRGTSEVLTLEGDLTSRFGATGLQGDLWSGRRLRLKYLGDLLFANAKITEHDISVRTHRVRAGMEGSLRVGGTLRPYGEVYVRRDGGSAETGTGLEVGGGVSWEYPAYRLKADVRSRRLVLHTADGFTEWSFSGALVYGGHTSGLTLALRPMWGSAAGSTLYRQPILQERLAGGLRRTALEAGYGIPWGTRTVRSLLGVTAFDKGAMYRLGSELVTQSAFGVSVSAQVHAPPHAPPALGIQLQSRFRY